MIETADRGRKNEKREKDMLSVDLSDDKVDVKYLFIKSAFYAINKKLINSMCRKKYRFCRS